MGDAGVPEGRAIPTVERGERHNEAAVLQCLLQLISSLPLDIHRIEIGVPSFAKSTRMNGSDLLHVGRRKPLERPHVDDQVESLGTKRTSEVVKRDGKRTVRRSRSNTLLQSVKLGGAFLLEFDCR